MRPHGNRVIHEKMRKGQRVDSSLANPEVRQAAPEAAPEGAGLPSRRPPLLRPPQRWAAAAPAPASLTVRFPPANRQALVNVQ